ncbi:MAG: tRNA (cytidine(56)-2'-O)-methyltransferase [Nitrososphaerales archaeon]
MRVSVLRIGHRFVRDYRVTTHVALVARAFGADQMLVVNAEDDIKRTIKTVNEHWGGNFEIKEINNWRNAIMEWKNNGGKVVHLTMYAINVDDMIEEIRNNHKDLMIIVGAEKVPKEVYEMSDYNVSIGNQPHSEIAALAIFLDRLYEGRQLKNEFNGRVRIIPSRKDKAVKNNVAS